MRAPQNRHSDGLPAQIEAVPRNVREVGIAQVDTAFPRLSRKICFEILLGDNLHDWRKMTLLSGLGKAQHI
ncbi:hypothetical protein [Rhizobium sp. AP16]|uniref:hypothetical protein n=1 Tax=Rhizobium sp. AP16 TaxID=1144306 RepID=UPI002869BD2C|nr:hypothetical protein [Rhizobium sp. AP16]